MIFQDRAFSDSDTYKGLSKYSNRVNASVLEGVKYYFEEKPDYKFLYNYGFTYEEYKDKKKKSFNYFNESLTGKFTRIVCDDYITIEYVDGRRKSYSITYRRRR